MQSWPQGVQSRVFETIDSTMAEAARVAPDLTGPTWIFSHEQTAGRGRRGRDWVQPNGNFSATLVWQPAGDVDNRALRSFVAALALREAFVAATGREIGFALKWPNDVLLNGGKVAGILLESIGDHLAVGIGVNLVAAPPLDQVEAGAVPPVSLLSEIGFKVEPQEFLTQLAAAFARFELQFTTYGFAPIRAAWLEHAARLGEVITAKTIQSEITGTFQTVDEQGLLVLKAADGIHRIAAADVFFDTAR
ncbi:MAG: BirA family biotin operon repressor/biotin-[acetyl-CoA-carboxylase] ligase [Paracoccaceae bacterium]|jgi:BirA family biotin operon repressor/biotin-[acetyl-CoA-carboxylase] ligase